MFISSRYVTILIITITIIRANRIRLCTFVHVRVTAALTLASLPWRAKEKHPVLRRGVLQGVCFYEYYNDL